MPIFKCGLFRKNSYDNLLNDPNSPKDFHKYFPNPDSFKQLIENWREREIGDNVVFVACIAEEALNNPRNSEC